MAERRLQVYGFEAHLRYMRDKASLRVEFEAFGRKQLSKRL